MAGSFARFRAVYEEAVATGMADPNAMVVSSVDADGQPSSAATADAHGQH